MQYSANPSSNVSKQIYEAPFQFNTANYIGGGPEAEPKEGVASSLNLNLKQVTSKLLPHC